MGRNKKKGELIKIDILRKNNSFASVLIAKFSKIIFGELIEPTGGVRFKTTNSAFLDAKRRERKKGEK